MTEYHHMPYPLRVNIRIDHSFVLFILIFEDIVPLVQHLALNTALFCGRRFSCDMLIFNEKLL